MSETFWKKRSHQKKHKSFIFLIGCYFIVGGLIDMNVGVFWETSVDFLKSVICNFSRNIAKVMSIWMSKVEQNSTAFKKWTGYFSVFYLDIACRTLEELSWMTLVKFVTFVVLKILDNLISMKNSLNANNCWYNQNFENCST